MLSWLEGETKPDVVNLQSSLFMGLAAPIKKTLGRPVCCMLQGEDLFLEGLQEPYHTEALELIRSNIESVDSFLAVSDYYADFMSRYLRIPESKIEVVPLGLNLEGYEARESASASPFTVGYFARIAPEKGLHILCEAYRSLRERGLMKGARLEVAGYLGSEHKDYLLGIEQHMKDWGLGEEFHYRGVLDRGQKIDFLKNLDVLSVPAPYAEPKGMCVLEAMACGVPVVEPRHGAFPEMLEKTGGGVLVEPEDSESLAKGILSLYENPSLREELGRRGQEGVQRHYNVRGMAHRALEVYSGLADRQGREAAGRVPVVA
jgi:glycosyltransferase involved in cell wall biosynthesis